MLGAIRRGALIGFIIGGTLAALLIWQGKSGSWETLEGSAIIAWLISYPVTFVFEAVEWGDRSDQWVAFIAVAVPLNWALLGAVVAALVRSVRNAKS